MALHQRNDRGEFVNPAGGGPKPKLKLRRGEDGKLEVDEPKPGTQAETRPDERPPEPEDPRGGHVNPHIAGF
jgi:hypothetical protein